MYPLLVYYPVNKSIDYIVWFSIWLFDSPLLVLILLCTCARIYACRCFILILQLTSVCAGLYHFLPPDSREFEDLAKIVSSCYLDSSSRGTFSYCKARLIHNELLEKEVQSSMSYVLLEKCMSEFVSFRPLGLIRRFFRLCASSSRSAERWSRRGAPIKSWLSRTASFIQTNPRYWPCTRCNVRLFTCFYMFLSFVCSLACPAPVDLREGFVGWPLQDYDARKSISG